MSESDAQWLRAGLADLAEETVGADLVAGALTRSRRLGVLRAVVGTTAAVLLALAVAGTALAFAPRPVGPPVLPPAVSATPTPPDEPDVTTPTPDPAASGSAVDPVESSTDGSPAAGQPKPSATRSTAPQRCHTDGLRARIDEFVPPGKAGSSSDATLALTNITDQPCTLYGYPGMQLLDAAGQPRPTTVTRVTAQPTLILLAPQQTAWAQFGWSFLPIGDEQDTTPLCAPNPAHAVVTPPDETTSLTIPTDIGPVCGHGEIFVLPFSAQRPW